MIRSLGIFLCFALGAVGCKPREATPVAGLLPVVATTSIIGDWVRAVGNDGVTLTVLVGPDGDPHEFEPVPADAVAIGHATLIFKNGLGLEPWLDKLVASSGAAGKLVTVTDGIVPRHVSPAEQSSQQPAGEIDPHAWQSVANAVVAVAAIRDALSAADPKHAAEYSANAAEYTQQLQQLDDWVRQQIATIPADRRKLVTTHDAFGYYGDRYGIDVSRSALESVTTEASDPSARQFADAVTQIKASHVPAIFFENVQNRKLIDRLASEAGVTVGPPLYSDALGPAGSPGETYIGMIRSNTAAIVKALSP